MTTHHVKCWYPFFDHVAQGFKSFEVRKDDRHYLPGDVMVLHEWRADWNPGYEDTGRTCERVIVYKLPGGRFGIADDYCVLGIAPVAGGGAHD